MMIVVQSVLDEWEYEERITGTLSPVLPYIAYIEVFDSDYFGIIKKCVLNGYPYYDIPAHPEYAHAFSVIESLYRKPDTHPQFNKVFQI